MTTPASIDWDRWGPGGAPGYDDDGGAPLATLLAIDPGGTHVGLAWFLETPRKAPGWECRLTVEVTPDDLGAMLRGMDLQHRYRPDVLVYERFQLYPEMAKTLIGSEMETSQCIGVIKHYTKRWGTTATLEQPASYQQTALGLLKARGMKSTAKRTKTGPHTLSAELHGWAYLFRSNLIKET